MFEEEIVPEGITVKAYRFPSPKDGKPTMSFMVRMSGPLCDKGNEIIGKTVLAEKADAKRAMDFHRTTKPKKWHSKQKHEEWNKTMSQLSDKYGNPLLDYTQIEGEQILETWKHDLKEAGLTMKIVSRKSNGDLDEEVLNWS